MPEGCPFAPRCDAAMKICIHQKPQSELINQDHAAACWMNVKARLEQETAEAPASVETDSPEKEEKTAEGGVENA